MFVTVVSFIPKNENKQTQTIWGEQQEFSRFYAFLLLLKIVVVKSEITQNKSQIRMPITALKIENKQSCPPSLASLARSLKRLDNEKRPRTSADCDEARESFYISIYVCVYVYVNVLIYMYTYHTHTRFIHTQPCTPSLPPSRIQATPPPPPPRSPKPKSSSPERQFSHRHRPIRYSLIINN